MKSQYHMVQNYVLHLQYVRCDTYRDKNMLKPKTKSDVICDQIDAIFDAKISRLQDAWYHRYCNPDDSSPNPPHRSTIDRWKNGWVPRTAENVLRLSGLLDIDPMALFEIPENNLAGFVQRLTSHILHGRLEKGPLSFVNNMFHSQSTWPPIEFAHNFYLRNWEAFEFEHDPDVRLNYYPTVELVANDWDGNSPRVYHFAYRRNLQHKPAWIPYGVVIQLGNDATLIHSSGDVMKKPTVDADGKTCVGTWFGEGAAVFKIASIHEFTAVIGPDCDLDKYVYFLK